MKRRKVHGDFFSMITPALGTRELKGSSSSSSTGTGSMSKQQQQAPQQQGGVDPCVPLLGCFILP